MAEDMFKMQQEAIRRAKEVYSRSGNRPPVKPGPLPQRESPPAADQPRKNEVKDILSTLFADKDKTLILALLLLLAEENCDHDLLFTLIYLLM